MAEHPPTLLKNVRGAVRCGGVCRGISSGDSGREGGCPGEENKKGGSDLQEG